MVYTKTSRPLLCMPYVIDFSWNHFYNRTVLFPQGKLTQRQFHQNNISATSQKKRVFIRIKIYEFPERRSMLTSLQRRLFSFPCNRCLSTYFVSFIMKMPPEKTAKIIYLFCDRTKKPLFFPPPFPDCGGRQSPIFYNNRYVICDRNLSTNFYV